MEEWNTFSSKLAVSRIRRTMYSKNTAPALPLFPPPPPSPEGGPEHPSRELTAGRAFEQTGLTKGSPCALDLISVGSRAKAKLLYAFSEFQQRCCPRPPHRGTPPGACQPRFGASCVRGCFPARPSGAGRRQGSSWRLEMQAVPI